MPARFNRVRKTLERLVPWRDPGGDEYVPGHGPRNNARRFPRDAVRKQPTDDGRGAERKATLPPNLLRELKNMGAVRKPYDAKLLKDVASFAIVQAFIDTLAQDVAGAKWTLTPRDEGVDPAAVQDQIEEASRALEQMHPEKTFRDLREIAARGMLTLGDATWVKHYYTESREELAEVLPVDSAMMFKRSNEHGITEGYAQAQISTETAVDYELDEVVWFEWASRPDHIYAHGPAEKALQAIQVLEELAEKEEKDLSQGMPPGIVSMLEDEDSPVPLDEFDRVEDSWELKEGERHRAILTRGNWDFTPLSPGYNDLQFLERSKYWVQVLGAVFKVNAPYAGFDFENTNRATNESQAEAYRQRGFRVMLRQMEEAINRQLIWPDISEDLQFSFEREQTPQQRTEQAEYLRNLAETAEKWANNGLDVRYQDGQLVIEDGEIEASNSGGEAGADEAGFGGGPFGLSAEEEDAAPRGQSAEPRAKEALDLTTPVGVDSIEATADVTGVWQDFLGELAVRGAAVVDGRGKQFPDEPIIPTGNLRVYGITADLAKELLARYGGLNYLVEQTTGTGAATSSRGDGAGADGGGGGPTAPGETAMADGAGTVADTGGTTADPSAATADTAGATVALSKEEADTIDRVLLDAHASQIQPETLDDIEKRAWDGDENVPEYVLDAIKKAIRNGAVFQHIDSLPGKVVDKVESLLEENLTQPQGWSLDSLVNDAADVFPGVARDRLETVMRTEVASVLNRAREEGYEERQDAATLRYKWTGPDDVRTTAICEELKRETHPDFGGDPVSMPDLVRLEQEKQRKHQPELDFRKHVPHINCRHTFVRHVPDDTTSPHGYGDLA